MVMFKMDSKCNRKKGTQANPLFLQKKISYTHDEEPVSIEERFVIVRKHYEGEKNCVYHQQDLMENFGPRDVR